MINELIFGALILVSLTIIPAFADLDDDKKKICKYYHGHYDDGECELENENLSDEYWDDVAFAEDGYALDKQLEEEEEEEEHEDDDE